jgi:hypothetical protein
MDRVGETTIEGRYERRPLLRLLDSYVLALTGNLDPAVELRVARIVRATFGGGPNWTRTLRTCVHLPGDMDQRIQQLWQAQPPDADPRAFAMAVSDETFAPLLDKE